MALAQPADDRTPKMLRNIPLLELVFDEPDAVAWDEAAKLVRVIERQVHQAYRGVALTVGPPPWDEEAYHVARTRALIAAPIERGSVIIPLSFELLPIHLQIFEIAQSGQHPLAYIKDVIGLFADAAGLLQFALGVAYGPSGVLAGNRKLPPAALAGELARAEGEVALQFLQQGANLAPELMKAAKASGCGYVAICWGDGKIIIAGSGQGDEVEVVPVDASPERRPTRFLRRVSDRASSVRFNGTALSAILARGRHGREFVLIWKSEAKIPNVGGDDFEVIGRFVQPKEIRWTKKMPEEWRTAEGFFLVESARTASFQ